MDMNKNDASSRQENQQKQSPDDDDDGRGQTRQMKNNNDEDAASSTTTTITEEAAPQVSRISQTTRATRTRNNALPRRSNIDAGIIEKRRRCRNERIQNRDRRISNVAITAGDQGNTNGDDSTSNNGRSDDVDDGDGDNSSDGIIMKATICDDRNNEGDSDSLEAFSSDESENEVAEDTSIERRRRREGENHVIFRPQPSDDHQNEEGSDDVVRALQSHPYLHQNSIGFAEEEPPTTEHQPNTISASVIPREHPPDYIPQESPPGAFWQVGRAVGDLPAWFSTSVASLRRRSGAIPRIGPTRSTGSISRPPSANPNHGQRGRITSSSTPSVDSHRLHNRRMVTSPTILNNSSSRSILSSVTAGSSIPRCNSHGNSSNLSNRTPLTSSPASSYRRRGFHRTGSTFRTSIRNFFRSTSNLPEAEALDAEKVVYAEVQQEQDDVGVFCSWELAIYTIAVLLLGIVIGRLTATTTTTTLESHHIGVL